MTFFLHIGSPKTGMAYIEEMFVANVGCFGVPDSSYPEPARDMTVHGRYPGRHDFA